MNGGNQVQQNNNPMRKPREYICYVCKADLFEEEKEFYPCNCKYQICHKCYYYQVDEKNRKCPNCDKIYEHQYSESSSNISGVSQKLIYQMKNMQEQNVGSLQKRTSSDNYRQQSIQKLSQVRILQKNTIYVIGVAPQIAKEEILRSYEYFGQYGKIQQITINKENPYQSENQGPCFSAYITYSHPKESSIAILAIDQYTHGEILMRASFGRTKYCKFFLKDTQCLNKDCPYQHFRSEDSDILTQDDMQKKSLFQQCQQLAFELSNLGEISEEQFRLQIKQFRDQFYPNIQVKPVLPPPECIFEKKSLFKVYSNLCKQNNVRKVRKLTTNEQQMYQQQKQKEQMVSQNTKNQTQKSHSRDQKKKDNKQIDAQRTKTEEKVRNGSHNGRNAANQELKEDCLHQCKRKNSLHQQEEPGKDQQVRMNNLEQQLLNTLRKQIGPNNTQKEEQIQQEMSTGQTGSIFNEKKNSRFLSLKDDCDEEELLREQRILYSQKGSYKQSHQKKASLQSLFLVESLKFLNDDNDIPKEKKFENMIYKTNPPSEFIHDNTPMRSVLGECVEDNYIWNTMTSNHDGTFHQPNTHEENSCFSLQDGIHNMNHSTYNEYNKNSLYTSSYFLINTQNNSQAARQSILTDVNSKMNNTLTYSKGDTIDFNNKRGNATLYNQAIGNVAANSSKIENSILNRCPSQPNKMFGTQNNQPLMQGNQGFQNMYQDGKFQSSKTINDLILQHSNSASMKQLNTIDQNRIHSQSQDLQHEVAHPLNRYNLDLFNKQFENQTYRDHLYSKIFLQQNVGVNSSNNLISSQSLFCYTSELDEEFNPDMIPKTPIKEKFGVFSVNDHQEVMSTQPKNYYKEFLSVKESFISSSISGRRRNSMDHEREVSGFEPQYLQFLTPIKAEKIADFDQMETINSVIKNSQQKSKSRSTSRGKQQL